MQRQATRRKAESLLAPRDVDKPACCSTGSSVESLVVERVPVQLVVAPQMSGSISQDDRERFALSGSPFVRLLRFLETCYSNTASTQVDTSSAHSTTRNGSSRWTRRRTRWQGRRSVWQASNAHRTSRVCRHYRLLWRGHRCTLSGELNTVLQGSSQPSSRVFS